MSDSNPKSRSLEIARARIADCLQLDEGGELVQRHDSLNLAGLDLTDDELTAPFVPPDRGLPEIGLASLTQLRYLDLTGNQLDFLPECITGFRDLIWLGLNFNRIARLPDGLGRLTRLERLYLRGNALKELPSDLGDLESLVELDLTGCRIETLPASMSRLRAMEDVALEEEALAPDQRAAWKEKGWKTLREHLERSVVETSVIQFVGKVVLVGSQENGKTCLQRALRGEPFREGLESTPGMSRERLYLRRDGAIVDGGKRARNPGPCEDVIDLTLWDMGGQESYQHTHQMFFTPSAVYLVVTLPRQGGSVQEIDKWIKLVHRRTGGEATVIVVSTACREKECKPDQAVTLAGLQANHGPAVRALVAVDSKDGTGIPELRAHLAATVQEPRAKCRHAWLRGWAQVLGELARSSEAFVRWPAIQAICRQHGLLDSEQQRQVIRTGHYIGSLLWREDIPAGEDVVILNPDWLSRAVARLLDDEVTRQARGLVDITKLDRVWAGPGRDGTDGYSPSTYPALIELMEINELAYRPKVPGRKIGEGHLLLVTQMVGDKPTHDVAKTWEEISPKGGAESVRVIAFRQAGGLRYECVPDLVYLLIFRLREFSIGRTDYTKAVHWQRGLLVTDDYGSAAKVELKEEQLHVTVRHRLGEGLMHSIVHRIGVRGDGYWNGRGLEMVEFVPCGRVCPRGTPDAGLISMEDCVEADRAGNPSVRCETCRKYVPIRDLLRTREQSDPGLQALFERIAELETNLGALIRSDGATTRQDLRELRDFVRMQGDGFLDALTSEWKDGPRLFSLLPLPGISWNPKTWTHLDFRLTIWCEASRRPVPLFGQFEKRTDGERVLRGSVTLTLTRDWVQTARKALSWASWLTLVLAAGGTAGLGGLVTATGGVISASEAEDFASELARQQKALKDVASAIPDEADHPFRGRAGEPGSGGTVDFSNLWMRGYGRPEEDDLKLIRFLRDEYRKKDPTWGGLHARRDGKFGRIWAHPKFVE